MTRADQKIRFSAAISRGIEVHQHGVDLRWASMTADGLPTFVRVREDGSLGTMFYTVDGYDAEWSEARLAETALLEQDETAILVNPAPAEASRA